MVKIGLKPQVPPEHQPDAIINVINPVSGTKYEWEYPPGTPLGAQKNVRIRGITIKCTWTVQPTPLEVHITIDGVPRIHAKIDPVSNTLYFVDEDMVNALTTQALQTSDRALYRAFLFEGRTVKVEAEVTGGTVSNLFCRVRRAKW